MRLLIFLFFLFFAKFTAAQNYYTYDSICAKDWTEIYPNKYIYDTIKCKLLVSVDNKLSVVSGYKLLRMKLGERVIDKSRKADGYLDKNKQLFDNSFIVWMDKPY